MENGHDHLGISRTQPSTMFPTSYYPQDTIGWDLHANDTSNDANTVENGGHPRILTRRQRAAMSVGRAVGNETPQQTTLYSPDPHLGFGSYYVGLPTHLDALSSPLTQSPNLNLQLNPSANPADISPPARRSHARHSSDAFSPRASSPASSIGTSSSSIASLLSYSTSTFSSTTGESSPARSPGELKGKHTKNKLRNSDRKDMCMFAEQFPHVKQEDIAVKYGVERSTVSKVLKNKTYWMSLEDEDVLKIIKHRKVPRGRRRCFEMDPRTIRSG
ncbi:hypothetical protein M408DRAFT_119051 [Serendipita vermifera MAFF 305830]|uniref:HTH psq-type domain-containing protein n=1 Tax=Serendipita vermifera MAFF 305830 TaxID=933852 RepID=A0A0C3ANJ8_SERVB|nr:hypothetical protein M408DRAFT_119051 [Serendipita vermifera MAFF 305830]